MKRMFTALVIIVVGLLVVGLLVLRHGIRTAPLMPPESDLPAPPATSARPMDQLQADVKLAPTSFQSDAERSRQLMEKLRQEELRQRPQEQRN